MPLTPPPAYPAQFDHFYEQQYREVMDEVAAEYGLPPDEFDYMSLPDEGGVFWENAKELAWKDLLRRLGRERVLDIPNLPPSLRGRLEKPKTKRAAK